MLVLALTACQPAPSAPRAGGALIVRPDGDLWRYDIDGRRLERLTEDDALQWSALGPGSRGDELRWQAPRVSPDGAWLAYSPHSGVYSPGGEHTPLVNVAPYMIVQPLSGDAAQVQVIKGTRDAVWAPDSRRLAFAPYLGSTWWAEDDPPLWVYDLSEESATPVLPGGTGITGAFELVWSPDSSSLAYIARLGEDIWEVQRLDVASGVAETVTAVEVGVASRPSVCWAEDGEVVVGGRVNARCSRDDGLCPPRRCNSPDRARVARLEPSEEDGVTRLWVEVAHSDGAPLWERELAGVVADRVVWSDDGSVLLLDGTLDAPLFRLGAPIWRVAADGTGEVEVVVQEGQLIRIVPQW